MSPLQKSSQIFEEFWLKHFAQESFPVNFGYFENISFIQHPRYPLYFNVGGTNTKGLSYTIDPYQEISHIRNKVFIIYDVRQHNLDCIQGEDTLKVIRVNQYPGFYCNLQQSPSADHYIRTRLSSKSLSKLKNYKNRLLRKHQIRYKMIWGNVEKDNYDFLFAHFHHMLVKRFQDKKELNNNLDPHEWTFYQEVSFPMLLAKEAGLFVTFDVERPIAITLLHFQGRRVFDVIRVFDIDYAEFRIGSLSIMEQIHWCYDNNFEILDFSKGDYDYKKKWCSHEYPLEYHIHYDPKDLLCKTIAHSLSCKYRLKLWGRKLKLQYYWHKLRYLFHPYDSNTAT